VVNLISTKPTKENIMKYVYIVTGEHDGFIGAYSNFKKASVIAKEYAAGSYETDELNAVTISEQSNEWITFYQGTNTSDVERTLVQ
jgi:hypothetical protein